MTSYDSHKAILKSLPLLARKGLTSRCPAIRSVDKLCGNNRFAVVLVEFRPARHCYIQLDNITVKFSKVTGDETATCVEYGTRPRTIVGEDLFPLWFHTINPQPGQIVRNKTLRRAAEEYLNYHLRRPGVIIDFLVMRSSQDLLNGFQFEVRRLDYRAALGPAPHHLFSGNQQLDVVRFYNHMDLHITTINQARRLEYYHRDSIPLPLLRNLRAISVTCPDTWASYQRLLEYLEMFLTSQFPIGFSYTEKLFFPVIVYFFDWFADEMHAEKTEFRGKLSVTLPLRNNPAAELNMWEGDEDTPSFVIEISARGTATPRAVVDPVDNPVD